MFDFNATPVASRIFRSGQPSSATMTMRRVSFFTRPAF